MIRIDPHLNRVYRAMASIAAIAVIAHIAIEPHRVRLRLADHVARVPAPDRGSPPGASDDEDATAGSSSPAALEHLIQYDLWFLDLDETQVPAFDPASSTSLAERHVDPMVVGPDEGGGEALSVATGYTRRVHPWIVDDSTLHAAMRQMQGSPDPAPPRLRSISGLDQGPTCLLNLNRKANLLRFHRPPGEQGPLSPAWTRILLTARSTSDGPQLDFKVEDEAIHAGPLPGRSRTPSTPRDDSDHDLPMYPLYEGTIPLQQTSNLVLLLSPFGGHAPRLGEQARAIIIRASVEPNRAAPATPPDNRAGTRADPANTAPGVTE